MATTLRRFRLLPVQLLLLLVVIACYLSYNVLLVSKPGKEMWQIREEELRKYSIRETSLEYVREAGMVGPEIGDLDDDDINAMNETRLMVTIHSYLDNTDTLCNRKIRMGNIGDGGWEICDDKGVRPVSDSCLVYSFGVREEYAFEDDVARVYKCHVDSFNNYISGRDYNRSDKIHVHNFGIGRYSEFMDDGRELYTFEDIRMILGHDKKRVDVIKMDIEAMEWGALGHMISTGDIDDVRQLLVECHVGFPPNADRLRRALRVLRGLSKTGFKKFYVHKNPHGSFHHPNFPVMRVKNYEVHYLNTEYVEEDE